MKKYVIGFYFYPDPPCKVVLIRKNKPDWQRGKWNAPGGHVEENESPLVAMRREFKEETGAEVSDWRSFAVLAGGGKLHQAGSYRVYCFTAMGQENVRTTTEELVGVWQLSHLPKNILDNLSYLIPMALDLNLESSILSYE